MNYLTQAQRLLLPHMQTAILEQRLKATDWKLTDEERIVEQRTLLEMFHIVDALELSWNEENKKG